MMSHRPGVAPLHRSFLFLVNGLVGLACAPGAPTVPLPLVAPVPATHAVAQGLRVLLVDADLPQLAETVRQQAGKTVDVAAAPWLLPGASGYLLGALGVVVVTAPGKAAWVTPGRLKLAFPTEKLTVALAVGPVGGAACALVWTAQAGDVAVQVEVTRTPQGAADTVLATEPAVAWQQAQLLDPDGCLTGTSLQAAVADHVEDQLRAALVARFSGAARQALRTVFAPSLELQGRLSVPLRWGDVVETRLSLAWQPVTPNAPLLVGHDGVSARGSLALSLDVDRAACAVDVPPPKLVASPLPPLPPAPPPGKAFLRRALVVDRAALAHFAWAAARAGGLCQESQGSSLEAWIESGWATAVLPGLADWVDGAPVAARFWPAASPEVRIVDSAEGPAVEWRIAKATLEIVGQVADTDLVLLSITGGFRAQLRPVLSPGAALGLKLVSTQRESTVAASPLYGDSLPPPLEPGIAKLVEAALRGIFEPTKVLPLGLLLPEGTVVTGVSHTSEALWLWLEGGPGG